MRQRRRLDELVEWYAVRDTFFGANGRKQDMIQGLRLARACEHEDSIWLVVLFQWSPKNDKGSKESVFGSLP